MKTYLGEVATATEIPLPQLPMIAEDQVYMINTQMGPMTIMTQTTYTKFGTMCEQLRNVARHLQRKMQEQAEQLETVRRIHADLVKQHNHLKETTQAARRASLASVFKPGAKT